MGKNIALLALIAMVNVSHDDVMYKAGQPLELSEKDAKPLLDVGAVKLASEVEAERAAAATPDEVEAAQAEADAKAALAAENADLKAELAALRAAAKPAAAKTAAAAK